MREMLIINNPSTSLSLTCASLLIHNFEFHSSYQYDYGGGVFFKFLQSFTFLEIPKFTKQSKVSQALIYMFQFPRLKVSETPGSSVLVYSIPFTKGPAPSEGKLKFWDAEAMILAVRVKIQGSSVSVCLGQKLMLL